MPIKYDWSIYIMYEIVIGHVWKRMSFQIELVCRSINPNNCKTKAFVICSSYQKGPTNQLTQLLVYCICPSAV